MVGARTTPNTITLGTLVGRLQRGLRRRVREALPQQPLPQAQVEVLRLLHAAPGVRVQEVASALHLAPNTASTLVGQLVRAGYVERTVDAEDRRVARLALTDSARLRLDRWRDAREATLHQALDVLAPADRERILAALPALERLADLLEEQLP